MTELTATTYPELADTYQVPQKKIDFCNEQGHVTLRGICSKDEVEPYRQLIADEIERGKATELGGVYAGDAKDRDTRYNAFLQFMNLWRRNETIAQFILAKRMAHVAAQLLGTDGVRIYHDQALFKEPGAGYTPVAPGPVLLAPRNRQNHHHVDAAY